MLNKVILMGRLTADPELRQTPNNLSVVSFSIAVDRDFTPKGEEKQTDFINIVAWRQTADFIAKYFAKGRMIIVEGSLRVRNYVDKQGAKRYATEVVAENAYFGDSKPGGSGAAPSNFGGQHPAAHQEEKGTSLSIGDIGDFEEIVDDDGLPF